MPISANERDPPVANTNPGWTCWGNQCWDGRNLVPLDSANMAKVLKRKAGGKTSAKCYTGGLLQQVKGGSQDSTTNAMSLDNSQFNTMHQTFMHMSRIVAARPCALKHGPCGSA